jgi:hypothetical protein
VDLNIDKKFSQPLHLVGFTANWARTSIEELLLLINAGSSTSAGQGSGPARYSN